jgi:enoyl-[acyl-carrier-protein] reductase (NADH)
MYLLIGARPGSAAIADGRALEEAGHLTVHTVSSKMIKRRVIEQPDGKYLGSDRVYLDRLKAGNRIIDIDVTDDDALCEALGQMRELSKAHGTSFKGLVYTAAGGGSAKGKVVGSEKPELTEEEWESARRVNYGGLERLLTLDAKAPDGPLFAPGSQVVAYTFLADMDDVPMEEYGHMRQLKKELQVNMEVYSGQFPQFGFSLMSTGPFPSMSAQAIPRFGEFQDWYEGKFPGWRHQGLSDICQRSAELLTDTTFHGFRLEYVDGGFHEAYLADPSIIDSLRAA